MVVGDARAMEWRRRSPTPADRTQAHTDHRIRPHEPHGPSRRRRDARRESSRRRRRDRRRRRATDGDGERPTRDDARRDRDEARGVEATTRDAERINETTRRRDRRAGEGDARAKATAMTTIEAKEIEALTIASMATRDAVRERRDEREKRERWRRMTRMRNQDV
jgi:hypothetical protein